MKKVPILENKNQITGNETIHNSHSGINRFFTSATLSEMMIDEIHNFTIAYF